MASRLIHLTIAHLLADRLSLQTDMKNSFMLGSILPDAVISADKGEVNSHYRSYCGEKELIMDFRKFRSEYSRYMNDSLYIGYYFHLIEDVLFRDYLYNHLGLLKYRGTDGFLQTLYKDYHGINRYLCDKYGDIFSVFIPENFRSERINDIYPFEIESFIDEMQDDIKDEKQASFTYFDIVNAAEIIDKCVLLLSEEYKALKENKTTLSPEDYSWKDNNMK